ncbi:MAG UNVERIFIED_CONTAM: hypothetical protein LVQ98_05190 [Rickettsiaceae bacterium]|jgi:chromatin segregation and condensation protein Rec8/ScpA/Scc1 (kleisin family)
MKKLFQTFIASILFITNSSAEIIQSDNYESIYTIIKESDIRAFSAF